MELGMRLTVAAVTTAIFLTSCASDPVRRDEAPASLVLRDAFFTASVAVGGMIYRSPDELGIRKRQFDPDRDEKLVFVVVLDPRYTVAVRGTLIRPDGQQHGTFLRELPAL
jgi:hypothetical protein